MGSNIVTLDISKLDNEIYAIEAEIAALNAKKALKMELKEYIKKNAIANGRHNEDEANRHPATAFNPEMGISDFILTYLKYYHDSDTKSIIAAYCQVKDKKYDEVANNVSNALSRLKTSGQLRSEEREGGRKAGLIWNLNR